jgi:hypothetical protein
MQLRRRHLLAVAALLGLSAHNGLAQTTAPSTGPTRIKIAAGTVSAEDTRVGLLGAWEPDADLGLPAGSNHTIYLADGLYINPFRNVALIAFWSTTASVLTSTPFDIRQLATGSPSPELKETFAQIGWDKATVTPIVWLTPDRFLDKSSQQAQRRAKPVHDVRTVHRATVMDLLRGSWMNPGGATVVFEADGTFREQVANRSLTGAYDFDATAGLLRRTNTDNNAASRATRVLQTRTRSSRLRWTSRDIVSVDGERWTRQGGAPEACTSCPTGGRGFLGVGTPRSGAAIVSIAANSTAAGVGLRPGDVIVGIDGMSVQNGAALRAALATRKGGDRVELAVSRTGSPTLNLTATLATGANGSGLLGAGLALSGAVVTQVQAGSPAERASVRVGDLIEAVNGRQIQDGDDLTRTMQAFVPGTDIVLTITRNGTRIEQRVTLGRLPQ